MAEAKVWSREEILNLWPQSEGELRGLLNHFNRRGIGITASQLEMALQLANAEFQRIKGLPVITEELVGAVRDFFARNIYKGYVIPFKLTAIRPSSLNPNVLIAIPENVDEEDIGDDQDHEWEARLGALGSRLGVRISLPHWVYAK